MKPKDAIKLDIVELHKYKTYLKYKARPNDR